MANTTYTVPSIHCDGCAASITRSLGKVSGVEIVSVDVEAKRVSVDYNPTTTDEVAISDRLAAAGFPAMTLSR